MVKEGQKGYSTYRAPQKALEIDLLQFNLKNCYTFQCLNNVNSRRNMFFSKIEKIAL